MLDVLKENLIPIRIKATIQYPENIIKSVEKLKSIGTDINKEDCFVGEEYFHAGAVDLFHNKTVELNYNHKGNWFYLTKTKIKELENSEAFFYNFESSYFKPYLLKNLEVIEYGQYNNEKTGAKFKNNKDIYSLSIGDKITFNLNTASKELILKSIETYLNVSKINFSSITKIEFNDKYSFSEDLNVNNIKPVEVLNVYGIATVDNSKEIHFKLYKTKVFFN